MEPNASKSLGKNKDIGDHDHNMEVIISSLPQEKGWFFETLYKYEGFWFSKHLLQGLLIAQQSFNAQQRNVILATFPKSGTTWFDALLFTLMNRARYDFSTHPLLTSSPHDCVPGIEFYVSENPSNSNSNPLIPTTNFSLLSTHIPFSLLPESLKLSTSFSPIVYVSRDPKDVFASLWHFSNKLRRKELPPLVFEEAFDWFCKGVSPFGSYWDHVLGFWNASLEMPNKVLFIRYEDMKGDHIHDPITQMRMLGNFVGYPFSMEEEKEGSIEKIVEFCSFESLTRLHVNRDGFMRGTLGTGENVANNVFFRKGEVGDHKNYLTDDMIKRLKEITEMRFKGSGLQIYST